MAAQDLERLVVSLSADIKKYENALNRANGITNTRARAIENRFAKMNKGIAAGFSGLAGGAVKAFAVIGGAQGLKALSDSATRIDNSLKVAGLSGEELEKVYASLRTSALSNAAPIETLAALYGKAAQSQKELGVTSEELLGFTNNVALALRVAGTDATTASGALLQLGQALGSGKVQAEEFNSVLDGAPTIVQAVAAGLKEAGGSVAKLKGLIVDGKVSSEAFFRAFEAGAPILQEKVAGSVFTIDQRMTNLQTALTDAARKFNESARAGETFGNEIDSVAKFVAGIDFDKLITGLQEVVRQFNEGTTAAASFLSKLGEVSGFEGIGRDIVNLLPGEGAIKGFDIPGLPGTGFRITSTAAVTDRINQAFAGEIEKAGQLTSDAIKNSALGKNGGVVDQTKASRVPAAPSTTVTPVSITDFKAPAGKSGGGGGGKKKADPYAREVEQIKERTLALGAETDAQKSVCGSIFILEEIR